MTAPRGIGAIAVVIPARDEEVLLPAALDSVGAAAGHAAIGSLRVLTVVVADCCTDATAAVPRRGRSRRTGPLPQRRPGPSRRRARRAQHARRHPRRCVDRVHRRRQHRAAGLARSSGGSRSRRLGRSRRHRDRGPLATSHDRPGRPPPPRLRDVPPPAGRPWQHPHVHGANLGVSSRAYAAAGGFPAAPLHEDRLLVDALTSTGARILRTADSPVTTSARTTPRARGGFGDHLSDLNRTRLTTSGNEA